MGSIFSREGSKDNRSRGGGGGGGRRGEEKEEEKRVICSANEPRRLNQDFVFTAYGTKDANKYVTKEKEKKGIMIFISTFIFILVREVATKAIEWEKREENEIGNTTSSSSSSSSLFDELQLLIMSKVPFHSLVKFRSVSKTWRSWIYKEHFFFGKCPQRTDGFFFYSGRIGQNGFIYTPLPDNYNEDDTDSYTIAVPAPTSSFPIPTIDDGSGLSFKICHHAYNGLLLLSTSQGRIFDLLIHNPFTRQSVLLPIVASQKFFIGPLWVSYEPRRSPYFNVVHALFMHEGPSLVLQIFSSRSWAWRDLVTDVRPVITRRRGSGRAVTYDGRMFMDLTFFCSIILVVDLRTGNDYIVVPLPPGLPPCLEDAWSALGMCEGNIMYAYTQSGVLFVYKLLCLEQGDYRWTLLLQDSFRDRIASQTCMTPTCNVWAQDFLLHVPVLLISATCSETQRCKVFFYNFTNGSILQVFESKSMIYRIIPLSICPLEICSGDSSL